MGLLDTKLSFETVAELLDDIVDNDFPHQYYAGLNGGIYLVPEEKHNPRIPSDNYYVLGEYCRSPVLGRCIYVYYGSFVKLYPHISTERARKILKETIAHELQHHLEGRAGNRDLEIEDEKYVQRALQGLRHMQDRKGG